MNLLNLDLWNTQKFSAFERREKYKVLLSLHSPYEVAKTAFKTGLGGGKSYFQNMTKIFNKSGVSWAMRNTITNQLSLETNSVCTARISENNFKIFGLHTLGIEPDDTWMF